MASETLVSVLAAIFTGICIICYCNVVWSQKKKLKEGTKRLQVLYTVDPSFQLLWRSAANADEFLAASLLTEFQLTYNTCLLISGLINASSLLCPGICCHHPHLPVSSLSVRSVRDPHLHIRRIFILLLLLSFGNESWWSE